MPRVREHAAISVHRPAARSRACGPSRPVSADRPHRVCTACESTWPWPTRFHPMKPT